MVGIVHIGETTGMEIIGMETAGIMVGIIAITTEEEEEEMMDTHTVLETQTEEHILQL